MTETGIININGYDLYFEWINKHLLANDKPVIVFLHHGLGSVAQWGKFPELVSKKTQLPAFVYDRYGHGKSSKLEESRNPDFIHQEALEQLPVLLEYLNINQNLILYGHSDGGSIALIFAAYFSSRLAKLIVEAPHVIIEDLTSQGLNNSVKEFKQGNLKSLLERYHFEKTESMFYGWSNAWLEEGQENWNILHLVAKITVPTMVIYGDQDEYGTLLQAEKIKENVQAKTEIIAIKDGNHFPHKQHEKMVLNRVIEFIEA